jgi:hypothetical protein
MAAVWNNSQGMCFVLTQAKYEMPMTDPSDSDTAASQQEEEEGEGGGLTKFDKAEIRNIILGAGGRILQAGAHKCTLFLY